MPADIPLSPSIDSPGPEAPARYFCPITAELMTDPVMDCHGHNFERAAILDWLTRSDECPMNRGSIQAELLFPNLALREDISEWLAASPLGLSQQSPCASPTQRSEVPLLAPTLPIHPDGATSAPSRRHLFGRSKSLFAQPLENALLQPPSECSTPRTPERRHLQEHSLSQEECDTLTSLFFSFCSGSLGRNEAQQLLRYGNYRQALVNLPLLFVRADAEGATLAQFLEFMGQGQNRPRPTTDYGISDGEYKSILHAFQGLDLNRTGEISREGLPQLCHAVRLPYEPTELPEGNNAVACHDFLLWCRRARIRQAGQRKALVNVNTVSRSSVRSSTAALCPPSNSNKFPVNATKSSHLVVRPEVVQGHLGSDLEFSSNLSVPSPASSPAASPSIRRVSPAGSVTRSKSTNLLSLLESTSPSSRSPRSARHFSMADPNSFSPRHLSPSPLVARLTVPDHNCSPRHFADAHVSPVIRARMPVSPSTTL
eukprot:GGOE01008687.1.p1 GENE.GGOE01008687.1~~GGOE01008687.1.p1  ORF type:complete len:492 (-),score=98.63 GGOE01008687.1:1625-3079(-)